MGIPSYREIDAALCGSGKPFEIKTAEVFGRATRVWSNAPCCLSDALVQGRALGGGRDFFVLGEERLSHDRHYELVCALAGALVEDLGVTKGDRVAIAMRNIPEWSIAFFAATMVGAIAVPLNAFWMMTNRIGLQGSVWFTTAEGEDMAAMAGAGTLDLSVLKHRISPLSKVNETLAGMDDRDGGFTTFVVDPARAS